jgi:predicted Zn-dependent protease
VSGARAHEELLGLARSALARAGVAEAQIALRDRTRHGARFSRGALGEHMVLSEPLALVRAAEGRRVAEVRTDDVDEEGLVAAVRAAHDAAKVAPETDGFDGFAGAGAPHVEPVRWAEATARIDEEARASRVAEVLRRVQNAGVLAAGMLETQATRSAIVTTRGCARGASSTVAGFRVWALESASGLGSAGYGGHLHRDVSALRVDEETERAIAVARDGRSPVAVDPGAWDVVMEPPALAELVEWLGAIAFGAREVEQGTSPLAGRLGERLTGESVTITEDPLDDSELGFGAPFDAEGVPRARVPLIEGGVARGVLYDRGHASRAGAASTGSALALEVPESTVGPTALHMAGGSAESVDELVRGMDRGLYVCRLHYVNGFVDTRRAVMTGLTRDGCFLVEKGKITRPVKNLRFCDSFLEALARADGMTRARRAIPTWWSDAGATVVPAVRIRGLTFVS